MKSLPKYVRMLQFIHELHFPKHVRPVSALLIHFEHHHLAGGFVRHLRTKY